MKLTNKRIAAMAITARIAGDDALHTPLTAEKQQAVTDEIRETLAKVDAAAGGLRGLFLIAVGETHTTFAVNASGAAAARLAFTAVDKGLELAEEIAQEKAADMLQMICNNAELMAIIRKEMRHDD